MKHANTDLFETLTQLLIISPDASTAQHDQKLVLWIYIIGGALVLLLGIFLRHVVERRKFYRRNVAGLEAFHSYTKSVLIPFVEGLLNLLGLLLIIVGGIVLMGSIGMLYEMH